MVGHHQSALELCRPGIQHGLAGGEEVSLTSALLLDNLHLQVPHNFAMSLWSNSAWEALQISASLMAVEQAALASWMVQAWVILASLTIAKQMALASRVTWELTALASLMVAKHKV